MNNTAFLERRREERILLNEKSMFIDIALNCPKGYQITKPIIDISASGLAFKLNEEEGYFLPGTTFRDIKIKDTKYEKSISSAVVRYYLPVKDENKTYYKIGLEFLVHPFEKSLLRRRLLNLYKIRTPRFDRRLFPTLCWTICFEYSDKWIVSNEMLNFSKSGIAFYIDKDDVIPKNGDILSEMIIKANEELLYMGRARVVSLEDNQLMRCSLEDGWLDTNKVFILAKRETIQKELVHFLTENETKKGITPEFKCEINDLRDFLQNLKTMLDTEEERLKHINLKEEKGYYEHVLLNTVSNSTFPIIDKSFVNIQRIVKDLSAEEDDLYKIYFRKQLHPLLLLSPFNNRSFHKPLGYSGDYEMMNMIYRDPDEGSTLFSRLMNRYILSKTAPNAVRGRANYITRRITQLLGELLRTKEKVCIMNIGCGSAKEIQELFKSNANIDRCSFMLIDAYEEPLIYSQDILLDLVRRYKRDAKFSFTQKDINQIIREKEWKKAQEKQDIIYSIGLFDYLKSTVASRLIKSLYEMLSDHGIMLIGNLNNNNDTKNFMEYVGEWYIIHRGENELLAFASGLSNEKNISIDTDDTKVCNFLIIQK